MKLFLFLLISLTVISAVIPAPHPAPHPAPPPPKKGGTEYHSWVLEKLRKFLQNRNLGIKGHETAGHSGGNPGGNPGGEITVDSIKQKNHISDEFSIFSFGKSDSGQKAPKGNNEFIKDDFHLVGGSSSSHGNMHETSFILSEKSHDLRTKPASDNFGGFNNELKRDNSHIDSDDASNSHGDIPLNKRTKTSSDSETKDAIDALGQFN